jgi:putative phosphoesterase
MARRAKHETRELDLAERDDATIVVVADTHSRPHPQAAERIAARSPDWILHAGDVGALRVVDALEEIAPCVAVRGNIDGHELPDSIAITITKRGAPLTRLLLTHIAVNGPRLRKDARLLAKDHDAQVVVCGHSHVPFFSSSGGLAVFNPGSIGPRRFALPITFGVMSLSKTGLSVSHIDCETGERWLPPA